MEKPKSRKLAKTVGLAASGQLGKALAIAKRVQTSAGSKPDETKEADFIVKAIVAHGEACLARARTALKERDVLHAVEVAQLVAKSLPRHDLGTEAKDLVKKTKTDAELKRELAAQIEFEKAMALSLKKGLRKARSAFLKIVKSYDGTRAAERAREVVE